MKKYVFLFMGLALLTAAALYACSGGGGGAVGGGTTGTVGLYLTDDMSVYSQVTATVNRVALTKSNGTGTACELLGAPVSVNVANMANVMQLVDVAQCPAGQYNRFRLEFDQDVQLMSGLTGSTTLCSFTSYRDHGMGNMPNMLNCDPATGVCSLDVNGAVNVLAMQDNKMALDFDLKNFSVTNYGMPDCAVTMKVSPMTPGQMKQHGSEAITGLVSGLNTTDMTFSLTRGNRTFSVLYSGITDSAQPGLGVLLKRAQDERLRTMVTASSIDLAHDTVTAAKIEVMLEGVVSNLTPTSFSLAYRNTGSMIVDYTGAVVSGTIADGSWVHVKLFGWDGSSDFLADKVEVGAVGSVIDN